MQTLFEKVGGMNQLRKLSNAFYDVMEEDSFASELRAIHPEKLHTTRIKFYQFITQWFGGPEIFGEAYVNVEWLEKRHRRKGINESLAQQWLYCMSKAMEHLGYETDLRVEVYKTFEGMIADMIQINQRAG